jgi:hypothetical protein
LSRLEKRAEATDNLGLALAIPIGSLTPGCEMRAHFAVILEIENERIRRQRNYDCFEPS